MKPIVVVGSINMDLVCRTGRIPQPGETITGLGFQMHSGGKGANQAVAVARLGWPSILLGMCGDDIFGRQLLSILTGYGVDTQHVGTVAGSSGTASIVVDAQGENTIIVTPGANLMVTEAYLKTKLDVLRGAGMVLAQLEIPLSTVQWLADCCAELNVPFMLDPAPAADLPASLLSKVTWFTPNQTEAEFYVPWTRFGEEIVPALLTAGIRNVILKLGSDGVLLATADGVLEKIPAYDMQAVDTTAAGDAFNGAFAMAVMRGQSPVESARFAVAAAGISVTREGAQPSLASQGEVDAVLFQDSLHPEP
ncbi:MAG: ribokinase [Acidobacteriota bacterium]